MVGKDHRFFDELGGFGPLSIADARGRALIIKNRTCFNAIEFHAACSISSLIKPLGKCLCHLYLLGQLEDRFIIQLDCAERCRFLPEGIDQIMRSGIDERLRLIIGKASI